MNRYVTEASVFLLFSFCRGDKLGHVSLPAMSTAAGLKPSLLPNKAWSPKRKAAFSCGHVIFSRRSSFGKKCHDLAKVLRKGIDRKRKKVSVRDNSNESQTVINKAGSQLVGSALIRKV